MKFREFIQNEARYKGFKRQFVMSNPGLPTYVANDIYNNRVGYKLRKFLGAPQVDAPTVDLGTRETTPMRNSPGLTTGILGQYGSFKDIKWSERPTVVTLSPLNFDDDTLQIFKVRQFGFRPSQQIRADAQRTAMQQQLMMNRGSQNEPIILIKDGDKYKLLEGWHRTMSYLIFEPNPGSGAPPDQIEFVKRGDWTRVDFTRWRPVPIQAYVGEKVTATL